MYDAHYMHNFDLLRDWILDVKEDNPNVIFALVGTRSDRLNPQIKTTTNYDKLEQLKQEFNIKIHYNTSAKQNSNIRQIFEEVAENFAINKLLT